MMIDMYLHKSYESAEFIKMSQNKKVSKLIGPAETQFEQNKHKWK